MGTKNNPGEFDCYENAEPDEPIFVLSARDPSAPLIVRQWAFHYKDRKIANGTCDDAADPEVRRSHPVLSRYARLAETEGAVSLFAAPQPEPPKEGTMKIIRLAAENVKRLVAVEITPEGNVIEITGKNGAGKTSVLDSIWWALAGNRTHQAVPVRRGETEAVISLDLGDIKVRREFSVREPKNGAASGQTVTRLFVESAEGARYPSPQKMLDELVGSLTFDPLAFSRMAPREKLAVLRGFVSGVDFEAEAAADRLEYQNRRDTNRTAKDSRTRMAGIQVPEVAGDEPDIEAHQRELKEAREHNRGVSKRFHDVQGANDRIASAADEVSHLEDLLKRAQGTYAHAVEFRKDLPAPGEDRDEQALSAAMREAVQLVGAHGERRGALTGAMTRRRSRSAQRPRASGSPRRWPPGLRGWRRPSPMPTCRCRGCP